MLIRPEVVVQNFRLILHGMAVCQVQRKLASGVRVEGWTLPPRELAKRDGIFGDSSPGNDLLGVKQIDGIFW